jgi:hypothetical protein
MTCKDNIRAVRLKDTNYRLFYHLETIIDTHFGVILASIQERIFRIVFNTICWYSLSRIIKPKLSRFRHYQELCYATSGYGAVQDLAIFENKHSFGSS